MMRQLAEVGGQRRVRRGAVGDDLRPDDVADGVPFRVADDVPVRVAGPRARAARSKSLAGYG